MASTYSTNLKIELITTGEQLNTWGTTTNNNLGTAIEQAIVGKGDVQFTNDANLTLTLANSNASQPARAYFLDVTSTLSLSAQRDLIVPTIEKPYLIRNATTGSQSIRIKTSAGTGIVVPNGARMMVYTDGVNVVDAVTHFNTLSAVSPAFTGTPTAPTAAGGTNTTQIATTAFTAAAVTAGLGTLGTISTQNANNVAITGGSITGITDLAITDGGTGASDAANARTNLGLGSIATQAANNVAITGGSITGITDLAVTDGGTGASDAAGARTNLGLGSISTQAANNVAITGGSITGITDLAVVDGGTGASDAAGARTNLGLGTMSTQAANNVAITGGSITGITDLAIADGGTGASTAAGAATNLAAAFGNLLYPVGSIYINATNSTNPGTLLGFGTWTAFGAGRVMVGFNASDALFDTAEETGGSKDAIVVSHTHTGTTASSGTHDHTFGYTNGSSGSAGAGVPLSDLAATGSSTVTTATAGAHTHTITTDSTGSSGTNANLQPYITVYLWKRTA